MGARLALILENEYNRQLITDQNSQLMLFSYVQLLDELPMLILSACMLFTL